ncbi:neuronal PAS domain-containing protein 2 [Bactrocera dorsalis]|uniref:Neuronal PAS domain-containing protein 2 n=1 Tax=Bactrocera dorsalis TaxID=27457 RepID=A0A8N4QDX1_BACDO|nr:neuronal PAS domain-containing protein 2 [Bactrocera dorsalis]XP_029408132.2 neuronal PAS domain-containing protein 2 [Bactrocera dorsalis]XP_029408138.2 neuronal PAS domain-containing protein 2 [Bactrocera dorsalis]XP_029408139.2 neuronal PAS domain-containing protein 2 [Bactrocera dorsalis]XP_029408141.2 neuronal PAS domain-containing protein 2 [Bactrocera dorsalis]XP_029408143.2 neuronal PAS domain-containing protein 2 [Bactrocera dorsalis]
MSQLGTVYATKRRRRNGKSLKPPPKDGVTKSNPSKRHRERLNAELDLLASLLPFEQNILSKLDRLSILRLSVSYLRTKSYFQVVMHKDKEENGMLPHIHTHAHDGYRTRELGAFEHGLLDGDMFLQALNGFLMILTCEGEVFFATHSIESYLGFHQSDIVHQSVYELVHSEDREELQRQLLWNSFLPADMSTIQLADTLAPDKALYLERSFTVRFRCLLDNTSGFLRLDIRGRIKILHGQNRKTEEPPLALFAYCTPFGPPSLLEIPHKENMFKSKHKLDFSLVSMDQRGKHVLGYSDAELVNMGGYDLVHYDDLAYVASAHQELLKTGASGMIAYRYQKKNGEWQWLQTSSRLVYKNSKPDFVICTHRQLMDEEGHDLLGKRTMDFKVSYLDTGLASTYFSEADQLVVPPSTSPNALPPPVTPTRPNRRYKTQLRDFLSTCRTKRKMQQQQPQQTSSLGQVNSPAPVVEYLPDPAVAVAAAYSNLNPMYTTSPYATAADNIYMGTSVHSTNFYPVTENLFHQYRLQGVSSYYTDYHHTGAPASAYVNGFLPYDGYTIAPKDDKWQETGKYYSGYSSGYGSPTSTPQQVPLKTPKSSPHIMEVVSCSSDGPSPIDGSGAVAAAAHAARVGTNTNITVNGGSGSGGSATPKLELSATQQDPYERQTVLMWGSQSSGIPINSIGSGSSRRHHSNAERSPQATPLTNGLSYANNNNNNENEVVSAKWNGSATVKDVKNAATPDSYQLQHDDSGLYSSSSHTTSPQQQQQQQVLLNNHQQQQQQQQLEQLELQQLSYTNHLQTLTGCNSTASSSSSPTCHSPSAGSGATALTNSTAANGHIALMNGGGSNGSDTDIPSSSSAPTASAASAAAAAAAAAYHHHHQLTIIAPIVITPASMMNGDGALPLSTALQPIHGSEAITTTAAATALNGLEHNLTQRAITSSQHHAAHLLSHTALAYAPNAATATYLISGSGGPTVLGGGSGNTQGSIISNGISDHIMANGNPLCSFSEVTNTLLNQ